MLSAAWCCVTALSVTEVLSATAPVPSKLIALAVTSPVKEKF